jgi:hypothetical protein
MIKWYLTGMKELSEVSNITERRELYNDFQEKTTLNYGTHYFYYILFLFSIGLNINQRTAFI